MRSLLKLKLMENYRDFLGLGIAGNFALHLAQAGELEDFKEIITAEEAAPKGVFPFYLPHHNSKLSIYPLSSSTIKLKDDKTNTQIEPEVALICELEYKDDLVKSIKPTHFGAYNDCSLRVAGATKISQKKNWGENSKGLSQTLLKLNSFSSGSILDNYAISSFLKREDKLYQYGEDVELLGYSYFYEKLLEWIKNQLNTQKDFGPLEDIKSYIKECNYPKKAIISIGATRYTEFGEHTFLKDNDEIFVALYDKTKHNNIALALTKETISDDISLLHQKVKL